MNIASTNANGSLVRGVFIEANISLEGRCSFYCGVVEGLFLDDAWKLIEWVPANFGNTSFPPENNQVDAFIGSIPSRKSLQLNIMNRLDHERTLLGVWDRPIARMPARNSLLNRRDF